MSETPRPPRLARWIMERALPSDVREDVSGDLEELFRRQYSASGVRQARRWYWRQTVSFSAQFVCERLRQRRTPARGARISIATLKAGVMRAPVSWLDFKLGLRMLVKYPGLSLVGGLGMAVAIAIGAGFFDVFSTYLDPSLPLDEGDRIVAIQHRDTTSGRPALPSVHDFVTWRDELKSVETLGAYRLISRNIITASHAAEPRTIAEITASGFPLTRVAPLLGRPLLEEDARAGAPPVIVIGYDVWRTRFAADPDVLGRTIRLGSSVHTVIGVMPERFTFPVNQHFWTPLRLDPSDYEPGRSPTVRVFARIAPGVTRDRAEAELTLIGQRMAAASPTTHERLRPVILPYTYPIHGVDDVELWWVGLVQLVVTLLLVVPCANVAILVYARTVTRHTEIAVRNALGASRRRIIGQLFVEALVLSVAAAAVALVLARIGLVQAHWLMAMQFGSDGPPFWLNAGLSSGTILYVAGLTVLAAVIAGVVPAIKATGRRVESELRQSTGATGMRLGGTWTALIVTQVAFSVAVLPAAIFMALQAIELAASRPQAPAHEILTARVVLDTETVPSAKADAYRREHAVRFGKRLDELIARVKTEPGVSHVTFAWTVPGDEPMASIQVDGGHPPATPAFRSRTRFLLVDVDFFEAFDLPVLTGRRFTSADREAPTSIIVNRAFVEQFIGDGNALGRRVRYLAEDGAADPLGADDRWYDVVGVVDDATQPPIAGQVAARIFHPVATGQHGANAIAVRLRSGTPTTFAARFREIATALDPSLRLQRVLPLTEVVSEEQEGMRLAAWAFGGVTLSVVLLAAAGIYALMSFTVAQRRREIGIRAALGAHPRRIVAGICSRALAQLTIGVAVGAIAAALLEMTTGGELMGGKGAVLLPAVSAFMIVVGLAAAIGPARRGLRIDPTEALREG